MFGGRLVVVVHFQWAEVVGAEVDRRLRIELVAHLATQASGIIGHAIPRMVRGYSMVPVGTGTNTG
jgi:hypothetical protein